MHRFTTLLTHTPGVCHLQVVQGINGPAKENTVFLPRECLHTKSVSGPCNSRWQQPRTTRRIAAHTGHRCPDSFTATGDMVEVVSSCEVVLMVVPTPFVERTLAPVADKFRPDGILVSCTKGILNDTLETREFV